MPNLVLNTHDMEIGTYTHTTCTYKMREISKTEQDKGKIAQELKVQDEKRIGSEDLLLPVQHTRCKCVGNG